MRNERSRDRFTEQEQRRIAGCAFSVAIVAAPFIALLYSQAIGLSVLAIALACTTYFAAEGYRQASGIHRRRLLMLSAVNAGFLAVVVVALVWLVTE
jgi:hypothetical protein